MKRIVILGGGTGGTLAANRLRRILSPDQASITVVDENDQHVYQPGLLFIPFGKERADGITRPRGRQLHRGVDYRRSAVESVELGSNTVHLVDGSDLDYDVLIVATGAVLSLEETEGLTGPGWMEKVFTFYSLEGATGLATALKEFGGGRVVVNVVDMPIKCPVAPLEFCFLADVFFKDRGIHDRVELTYVTPLDGAFTKPVCSRKLGGMLDERKLNLVTEFNTARVDGAGGRLVSYDGREIPFDLAVVIPVHSGASYVLQIRRPGRRARLHSRRRAHAAVQGCVQRVRPGRRGGRTNLEGGLRYALRGRNPRSQRLSVSGRKATRRVL